MLTTTLRPQFSHLHGCRFPLIKTRHPRMIPWARPFSAVASLKRKTIVLIWLRRSNLSVQSSNSDRWDTTLPLVKLQRRILPLHTWHKSQVCSCSIGKKTQPSKSMTHSPLPVRSATAIPHRPINATFDCELILIIIKVKLIIARERLKHIYF